MKVTESLLEVFHITIPWPLTQEEGQIQLQPGLYINSSTKIDGVLKSLTAQFDQHLNNLEIVPVYLIG